MVKIGDYLRDLVQKSQRGTCKVCGKAVQWTQAKLASHKRANCPVASVEERSLFLNQKPAASVVPDNDVSMSSMPELQDESMDATIPLTSSREIIDDALAKLFCRTGISFRILDSDVFRDFVKL